MKIEKIIVASGNKGKIEEIREILSEIQIIPMRELGFDEEIEETGKTLQENALIKAKTVANKFNLPTLADDSGLFVDALDGAPGVYSARYSGGGDLSNIGFLLENMKDKSDRHACCKCVVCLYFPDGQVFYGEGKMECDILRKPQGDCGFGYDPILYSYELKKSYGLATIEEKNSISHRKKALQDLLNQISKI